MPENVPDTHLARTGLTEDNTTILIFNSKELAFLFFKLSWTNKNLELSFALNLEKYCLSLFGVFLILTR